MDDEIRQQFDALNKRLDESFEGFGRRFDAIVMRLDEQDASHDRLMNKVDRLSTKVDQLSVLARAGEEAMTSLDALSRRVAKVEAAMRGKEE